jgi:hypothetical protein
MLLTACCSLQGYRVLVEHPSRLEPMTRREAYLGRRQLKKNSLPFRHLKLEALKV